MKFEKIGNSPNSILKFKHCFFSYNNQDINLYHQPELAIILSPFGEKQRGKCIIKYGDFRDILEACTELQAVYSFLGNTARYGFWSEGGDEEIIAFIDKLNAV